MALKKTVSLKAARSVSITDAYIRVNALRFDHPNRVYVQVAVFESPDSTEQLDTYEYEYSAKADFGGRDRVNVAAAYERIKMEDAWADAQDVK